MPRKKAARKGTGDLTFLVSTSIEKPDADTRKFIRSHVMVGKNVGKKLPPRKKERQEDDSSSTTDTSTPPEALPLCRRFASPRSAIVLADTIEHGELTAILQLSSVAKKLLFVLEPVLFFERRNEDWILPLTTDAAYLHCQVFNAETFLHGVQRVNTGQDMPLSRRASFHYFEALRLLSDRLSNEEDGRRWSNSTLATMIGFSGNSLLTGDFLMARKQVYGMFQIIRARGGIAAFIGGSEKLLAEVLRLDLGLALAQGLEPLFESVVPANETLLRHPNLTSLMDPSYRMPSAPSTNNHDLARAWISMADFSKLVNFAVATEHRISTLTFLHTMTAVMYRLLSIEVYEERDEVIRLGLLVYTSGAFLPWRSLGLSYAYLTATFTHGFTQWRDAQGSPRLSLWLMMIASISLFDESEDWIRPFFISSTEACGVETWEDMRSLMNEFMWVDLIHNEPGQRAFSRLIDKSIVGSSSIHSGSSI